ncbi:YdeI/OmpD-associated family protein [Dyadobacter jiangsuensis]|uniref:Uncharacterized protein YdeI (YjbR/CyaY-like superfamily) n=1 Tax=Dyadobacter jiangsuensis TaxID=1591085 RepID=A0A2P8GCC9_9BACT|nr:YdeI/OmpD-associated family protein [Dyadobacter jiangsuensis]PSL31616.1 uncharacterized protein YdeI (YjbR/CyaY-like superfamily) [Dyadobacter jiangsuensis]
MSAKETEVFCPANRQQWRQWLIQNHISKGSVWLVYYKKGANVSTITWSEAVDEALCFGWIDSLARPLDAERYMQFFSKRKPGGGWSKINKEKILRLTRVGLMTRAGLEAIAVAKQNGSWSLLDKVEELIVPDDLESALAKSDVAYSFFENLGRSDKRNLLQWIAFAKRQETRQKRIDEIVEYASKKMKPSILSWKKKAG